MKQGDRLRKYRKNKGLSQESLAALCNMSRVTITQIENGNVKSIDGSNLINICNVLNISPQWLTTGKGDPSPASLTEVQEPAAAYQANPKSKPHMPWPSSPAQINMLLIEDIASRVSKETGKPIEQMRNILIESIKDHYAPSIDPAYIDACAKIALEEIEDEKGFVFKGKDRDTMLTSLKREIALTTIEESASEKGGKLDQTPPKISNGN
jgi:transcriptional regulator with XRE-family HTH domain